jgi:hypothetical protein
MADHFLAEIPETGTYHAGIASRIEKICSSRTHLPSLALELFPAAPYKRTGIMTLPLWNDYQMAYLFLKSEFHGYRGTLVLVIRESAVDALSVQLKRDDREIKIVEGENFSIRDNQGLDLGSFDTTSSAVAALDRALGRGHGTHEP